MISLNPAAIETATAQDKALSTGATPHGLFGIPILIKDNIETLELPTTAGSLALKDNFTGRDAAVITRLRDAGAIILGKTNLSEWANFRSERSSSGWSALGGQTRNPHDLARSTSGSSSGSAVAVSANLSIVAIGTETDGSIVSPASFTGIVGIKPSIGLVNQSGIIPISHTQDTAGPMGRSVEDVSTLLSCMTDKAQPNFLSDLTSASLQGKRIGILRSATHDHEGIDSLFEDAIIAIRSAGATIVEDIHFSPPKKFGRTSYDVLLYEFKHNINRYLAGTPDTVLVSNLKGLIEFNQVHKHEEMYYFEQETFEKAQAKGPLTEQTYLDALQFVKQATQTDGIDQALNSLNLDALIAPTESAAGMIDLVNGDHSIGGGISSYPAISGYPHVTLPMGKLHGLPVGLSFIGSANQDFELLKLAYCYEQLTPDTLSI